MEQNSPQELTFTNDRLLVFIDDTGHETFKGSEIYYGLGGCVVLGAHYELLKTHWKEVRRVINGSPDAPLHAFEMEQKPSNFEALSQFFLDRSFARIAAASTKKTTGPPDMHSAEPVIGMLEEHIDGIARLVPCSGVMIIVESSQRADPILKQLFGKLKSEGVERVRPVEYCLMPKSSAEPGLEIADFIISAARSQTKRLAEGKAGLARDFADVFDRLPREGCRFSYVAEVVDDDSEDGRRGIKGFRFVAGRA
jgi:Protein of unknown function (DUF3800)